MADTSTYKFVYTVRGIINIGDEIPGIPNPTSVFETDVVKFASGINTFPVPTFVTGGLGNDLAGLIYIPSPALIGVASFQVLAGGIVGGFVLSPANPSFFALSRTTETVSFTLVTGTGVDVAGFRLIWI